MGEKKNEEKKKEEIHPVQHFICPDKQIIKCFNWTGYYLYNYCC